MTEALRRRVRVALLTVEWTYLVYRHHHYSLTCSGDHPCDPRAHLHVADAIRIAKVLA